MTNKETITQKEEKRHILAIKEATGYSKNTICEYELVTDKAVNLFCNPNLANQEVIEITCLLSLNGSKDTIIEVIHECRMETKQELAEHYYTMARLFLHHFKNLNRYAIEMLDKAKSIDPKVVIPNL